MIVSHDHKMAQQQTAVFLIAALYCIVTASQTVPVVLWHGMGKKTSMIMHVNISLNSPPPQKKSKCVVHSTFITKPNTLDIHIVTDIYVVPA